MRRYEEPPDALHEEKARGDKLISGFLLAGDWKRMEEAIQSESRRLLSLFPRFRTYIRWHGLGWRILLEDMRGDSMAQMQFLRERLRMRPQTAWVRAQDHLCLANLLCKQGDVESAVRELNRGIRFALEHGDSMAITLMHRLAELGQLPLRARYVRAVQMVSTRFLERPVGVPRTTEELHRVVNDIHRQMVRGAARPG